VLSDPRKRAAYDQFGHAGVQGAASSGLDPNAFADFSDILGDFFGFGDLFGRQGGRRRTRAQRGDDLRYDLELSFEDAVRGCRRRSSFRGRRSATAAWARAPNRAT